MLDQSGLRRAIAAAALVTHMAVTTAASAWLGSWLDGRFETTPWLTLVGTFLGFGVGLYRLFKALERLNPPDDPVDDEPFDDPPH